MVVSVRPEVQPELYWEIQVNLDFFARVMSAWQVLEAALIGGFVRVCKMQEK